MLQGEQRLRTAGFDPAGHVGHQQAFFVVLVLHQRQLVGVQLARQVARLQFAVDKVGKALSDLLVVGAFDLRPLFADVAHAVEEQRLHLVVFGFFGALK